MASQKKMIEEYTLEEINETTSINKETETKEKLKGYYKSKDKLIPLFDDHDQSIDTCYIRLVLLSQQQLNEGKQQIQDKTVNKEKMKKSEENEAWPNTLDYSLMHTSKQGTMELQDIWKDEENESIRVVTLSVLAQRIAYLWAKDGMWSDQFQWLLHIPLRKIVSIFDDEKDSKSDINMESKWSKIMNELSIPQWNASDTKCVMRCMNGLLLLLDGFDEIANQVHKSSGLRQWLQYCTADSNNCHVIITSRPNAMCSYLNNPRMLNVIGFQSQDIHNYVRAYFQNMISGDNYDNGKYHADLLIQKLSNNPSLKLLSHTPLYLRLFCYLVRQQIKETKEEEKESKSSLDKLDNISLSKLYQTLLESYMQWNWIKLNGTKSKSNEQSMFGFFAMEIDYLSQLAWEGLRHGQAVISCEIQQRILDIIKSKYPRKHISEISQWSRINSFGFLQGQESVNSTHPMDSVYFPHLTFQEWLAAYYLVHCLYRPVGTNDHQKVRSVLINKSLTPKFSVMIPFMAGILYDNIQNEKSPSASGLLYFWKLLHLLPSQVTPVHQMMLHMRCLDACKADTDSPFLPSQLRNCHEMLIASFKSLLVAWINFDKDIGYVYYKNYYGSYTRTTNRPMDNVMELYLPNFRHLLIHPVIHMCIIDQIKLFQKQWSVTIDNHGLIKDRLYLLTCLCISTETVNIVVQCFKETLSSLYPINRRMCEEALLAVGMKLKEDQLDIIVKFLLDGFHDKSAHSIYVGSLEKMALNLNERQLSGIFEQLMNEWNSNKIHFCSACASTLATIAVKLGGRQLDDAYQYLTNRLHNNDETNFCTCASSLGKIAMTLNEKQFNDAFMILKTGFTKQDEEIRRTCATILDQLSSKLNERQLNDASQCLMNEVKSEGKYYYWEYIAALGKIVTKLNGTRFDEVMAYLKQTLRDKDKCEYTRKECAQALELLGMQSDKVQIDDIFKCLTNMLKDNEKYVRQSCADAIANLSSKLNEMQCDILVECIVDGFSNKNGYCCQISERLVNAMAMQLNEKQLCDLFATLIDDSKHSNDDVCKSCAISIGKLAVKFNPKQFDNACQWLKSKLQDEDRVTDGTVRSSCAEALSEMAKRCNAKQLDDICSCLLHGMQDTHWLVRGSCAAAIENIAIQLNEKQLDDAMNCLKRGCNNEDLYSRISCVRAFGGVILGELKSTQLYFAVSELLQLLKCQNTFVCEIANKVLSTMSEDIWRLVTIETLRENMDLKLIMQLERKEQGQQPTEKTSVRKASSSVWEWFFGNTKERVEQKQALETKVMNNNLEMKRLAFALSVFNPRIQFSFNDNISPDAFNELIHLCNEQAFEWDFPTEHKWSDYNNIPYPQLSNDEIILQSQQLFKDNKCQGHYNAIHKAAQSGDISQLKFELQQHHHIDINNSFNECGQTPLHLAINNKHWDTVRYCIEQGAWIDVREDAVDIKTARTPFEYVIEQTMRAKKEKNEKEYFEILETCKWILRKRTMYPLKRIEYAIDYVKDKIIDAINDESYETLLQEGATFLLGVNEKELKETLIQNNLLYWAAGRNVVSITAENSIKRKFDKGWAPVPFLINRIFLLFEVCVQMKREGRHFIGLPRRTTTFEQVYEKGIKELQVQLTTYWDYIVTEEFKHKFPNLIDDWSCNVVDRLMGLKPIPLNSCCEISLVVGHEGHCIYLSLCKTSDSILVRVDNRWMETVPSDTPHPRDEHKLIQPYLTAYFPWNGANIDQNKKWLKEYIKNATQLRDSNSNISMKHLYCSDGNNKQSLNNSLPPREGSLPSVVKHWPYRPIQIDANNCYLRSHNVGYRVRLGDDIYQWFRNQESKSFVFNRSNYNEAINNKSSTYENANSVKGGNSSNTYLSSSSNLPTHSELMKLLSKQLKVPYDEVYNGIAVEQALVAKANIYAIQKGAFYRRDESTNQTYFQLYLSLSERSHFYQVYHSQFPKLIQHFKEIDQNWVQYFFDTHVFYYQVLPSLFSCPYASL
ncbi:NTPase [Reticulomyxa filosa]|uniref:NTPase n=1 Tax=Reticulomyxa filosa TaxID=46433 RepID=X6MV23_RETFI|nr:NTPase [Reticulomyxa filosa]|eukprot:ETO17843.1 NTPase [Reticulomyxa filosa]